MTDHFCELPDPDGPGMRGRSHQCPECHAEWQVMVGFGQDGSGPGWVQRVSAEESAKQVEELMHELAHEDIDPAVIHAYVSCASHAVQAIANVVWASHGPAAGTVIGEAWNLFIQSVHPYFLDRPCEHHTFATGGENDPG